MLQELARATSPASGLGRTASRSVDTLRLCDISDLVGGRCVGDPDRSLSGVAPVDEAGEDQIAFLAAPKYLKYVEGCRAGAFLVSERLAGALPVGSSAVVVDDPYPALQRLLVRLHPSADHPSEVHPTAVLGRGVILGPGASVGPYAVLESGVTIGSGSRVGPHCVLGANTTIGSNSVLHPHVVTYHDTPIGDEVEIHSGTRLGADGFGYTRIDGEHRKIPQVGRCVVGDGVEIGANTAIDRGSLGDTRIESGVKIDNLVHIAHNVRIGIRSLLAGQVGVSGSTRIGKDVWLGGQAGVANHLEVGDGARVTVRAGVTSSVPASTTMFGFPARPHAEGIRRQTDVGRIPHLREQVEELEAEVRRLSALVEGDDAQGE